MSKLVAVVDPEKIPQDYDIELAMATEVVFSQMHVVFSSTYHLSFFLFPFQPNPTYPSQLVFSLRSGHADCVTARVVIIGGITVVPPELAQPKEKTHVAARVTSIALQSLPVIIGGITVVPPERGAAQRKGAWEQLVLKAWCPSASQPLA